MLRLMVIGMVLGALVGCGITDGDSRGSKSAIYDGTYTDEQGYVTAAINAPSLKFSELANNGKNRGLPHNSSISYEISAVLDSQWVSPLTNQEVLRFSIQSIKQIMPNGVLADRDSSIMINSGFQKSPGVFKIDVTQDDKDQLWVASKFRLTRVE